jgi:hypothetical protein
MPIWLSVIVPFIVAGVIKCARMPSRRRMSESQSKRAGQAGDGHFLLESNGQPAIKFTQ